MAGNSTLGKTKTRFLILSDTHGEDIGNEGKNLPHADVAVHCGDLTEESKLEEYRASLRLLINIQAPLKLVIAGNHDFTLDVPNFKHKVAQAQQSLEPDLVKKTFGDWGEARQLFEEARSAGINFLDEGIHRFTLGNGAVLVVYASPFTPSLGDWGFQYSRNQGHEFEVPEGIDLIMTHGPPRGIMDYTESKQRAGCPRLFEAVARAQPRLHCFGHIHEGWGARMVTWRDQLTETPSHFTDINNDESTVIEKLSGFMVTRFDTLDSKNEKIRRERYYLEQGRYSTSHCEGDANPLNTEGQTLFINAAIQGTEERPLQLPWLVDIELSPAT